MITRRSPLTSRIASQAETAVAMMADLSSFSQLIPPDGFGISVV